MCATSTRSCAMTTTPRSPHANSTRSRRRAAISSRWTGPTTPFPRPTCSAPRSTTTTTWPSSSLSSTGTRSSRCGNCAASTRTEATPRFSTTRRWARRQRSCTPTRSVSYKRSSTTRYSRPRASLAYGPPTRWVTTSRFTRLTARRCSASSTHCGSRRSARTPPIMPCPTSSRPRTRAGRTTLAPSLSPRASAARRFAPSCVRRTTTTAGS
mmetsp:Transcript_19914/g.42878  ORF Transcript_19914/g.42878 Transcript_19914/m.42878 type:complete len:211 (-) Transcript_19914:838-1470(-)